MPVRAQKLFVCMCMYLWMSVSNSARVIAELFVEQSLSHAIISRWPGSNFSVIVHMQPSNCAKFSTWIPRESINSLSWLFPCRWAIRLPTVNSRISLDFLSIRKCFVAPVRPIKAIFCQGLKWMKTEDVYLSWRYMQVNSTIIYAYWFTHLPKIVQMALKVADTPRFAQTKASPSTQVIWGMLTRRIFPMTHLIFQPWLCEIGLSIFLVMRPLLEH